VKLPASVAVQMLELGSRVGLLAAGAKVWSQPASADPRQKVRILDALARVQADGDADLAAQMQFRRTFAPEGGMMVVISPLRTQTVIEVAAGLVREGYAVTWMIPATPWREPARYEMSEDQLAARLASRGLRAYVIDPGRDLAVSLRRRYRVA